MFRKSCFGCGTWLRHRRYAHVNGRPYCRACIRLLRDGASALSAALRKTIPPCAAMANAFQSLGRAFCETATSLKEAYGHSSRRVPNA